MPTTLGRNDPCHCGSGRKYKHCCLAKDEGAAREARAKTAAEETKSASEPSAAPTAPARQKSHQPWRGGAHQNTRGFQKVSVPRKVGGG